MLPNRLAMLSGAVGEGALCGRLGDQMIDHRACCASTPRYLDRIVPPQSPAFLDGALRAVVDLAALRLSRLRETEDDALAVIDPVAGGQFNRWHVFWAMLIVHNGVPERRLTLKHASSAGFHNVLR